MHDKAGALGELPPPLFLLKVSKRKYSCLYTLCLPGRYLSKFIGSFALFGDGGGDMYLVLLLLSTYSRHTHTHTQHSTGASPSVMVLPCGARI